MAIKTIYARLQYKEALCPERTGCLRPLSSDDEKAEKGKCDNCSAPLFFVPDPYSTIVSLACSVKCKDDLEWFVPSVKYSTTQKVSTKSTKLKFCPDCGGPSAKGRGWKHKDGCSSLKKTKSSKPPCFKCGGLPKGRGWEHKEDCSLNSKEKRSDKPPFCLDCGGPSVQGPGWRHKPDCPGVLAAKKKRQHSKEKKLNTKDEETFQQIRKVDPQTAEEWKKERL